IKGIIHRKQKNDRYDGRCQDSKNPQRTSRKVKKHQINDDRNRSPHTNIQEINRYIEIHQNATYRSYRQITKHQITSRTTVSLIEEQHTDHHQKNKYENQHFSGRNIPP